MKARLIIYILATGFIGSACSPAPSDPLSGVTGFCQERAAAECQAAAVCAVDTATCESYRASVCADDAAQATASGVRQYTSGNAQACIDALNAAYGGGKNEILRAQLVGPGTVGDKCQRVFVGTAAANKSCTTDYDCADNRICAPAAPGAVAMVCADAVPEALGGFCANPGSQCATDSYCALPSGGGAAQCVPSVAVGQPCSDAMPCVSADRCVAAACEERASGGGACVTDDDCGPVDPYCDIYAGNICTIGLTFAAGAFDCREFQPTSVVGTGAMTPNQDAGATVSGDAGVE